jgi:hypothetical protein
VARNSEREGKSGFGPLEEALASSLAHWRVACRGKTDESVGAEQSRALELLRGGEGKTCFSSTPRLDKGRRGPTHVGSGEVEHGRGGNSGRHQSKLWTRHGSFGVWHTRRENRRWAGWASGQTKTNTINFPILSKHSNMQIVKSVFPWIQNFRNLTS